MLTELLEALKKVTNVKENRGKQLVKNAMALAHYKDTLVGIWWYKLSNGRIEYSEKATTHQDPDIFTPVGEDSRGWVRGRVFKEGDKAFIVVYLEDWQKYVVRGETIADIADKLSELSSVPIAGVVDEEGYDLLNDEGKL